MKHKTCLRCGHKWYPRTPKQPKRCPGCGSPYWETVARTQSAKKRLYPLPDNACDIIKQHHEDMKDDPERLTTDFVKRIVNIECDD